MDVNLRDLLDVYPMFTLHTSRLILKAFPQCHPHTVLCVATGLVSLIEVGRFYGLEGFQQFQS